MSTLSSRLDNFPEAWKPAAGEKLIGTLVDVDMRASEYGDPYPILTIRDKHGSEWAWHAFHTMARNEVAKKAPQIGETIGVAYHGKGTASPGMNAPERWRLIVDRETEKKVDWDKIVPAVAEPPEQTATTPADADIPF